MKGLVDEKTIKKAAAVGIDITGGSINKKDGRVRIFVKGKVPGTHGSGYALRSRVVWWLNTGEVLIGSGDFDIHHKTQNRADDRFDKLEKLDHRKHARHHNPKTVVMVRCECKKCGKIFRLEQWRFKDESRGQYCSQRCYQTRVRTIVRFTKNCEQCGMSFVCLPSHKRRFCSNACSANHQWSRR